MLELFCPCQKLPLDIRIYVPGKNSTSCCTHFAINQPCGSMHCHTHNSNPYKSPLKCFIRLQNVSRLLHFSSWRWSLEKVALGQHTKVNIAISTLTNYGEHNMSLFAYKLKITHEISQYGDIIAKTCWSYLVPTNFVSTFVNFCYHLLLI